MATYTISSENKLFQFLQSDSHKSILQNIALLLCTKKGTIPLNRDFGLDMKFIDKPIEVAETIAYTEVTEAVEEYEPRATVIDVAFQKSSSGKMILIAEVEITDEQE